MPGRQHIVKGARPASKKRGENSGQSQVTSEGSGSERKIGQGQVEGSEVELGSKGGEDQMMLGGEEESFWPPETVQDRQGGEEESSTSPQCVQNFPEPQEGENESSGAAQIVQVSPKPKTTSGYKFFEIK